VRRHQNGCVPLWRGTAIDVCMHVRIFWSSNTFQGVKKQKEKLTSRAPIFVSHALDCRVSWTTRKGVIAQGTLRALGLDNDVHADFAFEAFFLCLLLLPSFSLPLLLLLAWCRWGSIRELASEYSEHVLFSKDALGSSRCSWRLEPPSLSVLLRKPSEMPTALEVCEWFKPRTLFPMDLNFARIAMLVRDLLGAGKPDQRSNFHMIASTLLVTMQKIQAVLWWSIYITPCLSSYNGTPRYSRYAPPLGPQKSAFRDHHGD
jgi:hypothetical protein